MGRSKRRDTTGSAFDLVLRGYHKRQVDERLRLLGCELLAAQNELQAAIQRIATLEDALNQARAAPSDEPAADKHFGARIEKILKLAEDEAREVRAQAEAAAVALVDQAHIEGERLIATARETAAQRERSSVHELHQLFRLQEEINTDLRRVKDALDSLFGPGGALTGPILNKRRKDNNAQPTHQARTV